MRRSFFFSGKGISDPLAELNEAIKAFQDDKKSWGHVKQSSQCAYPARFYRLEKKWPGLFKKRQKCKEFDEWRGKLNAERISIIYAGAYPNNPASMFGHTILRIHNKLKNDLLDYNVGFQAKIDPEDNPVTYTLKGLMGGYPGFYNIDPYYINIGLYNNSESRDLWEYDISFTEKEVSFFIKHLWEVSLNTGFKYFFLDENCSYYLLTLIEATRPDLRLVEKLDFFIYPIEAVKLAVSKDQKPHFRAAIKRVLKDKIKKMNRDQRHKFSKAKVEIEALKKIRDVVVLDTLADFWKLKNYKKRNKLKRSDEALMEETLRMRASQKKITSYKKLSSTVSPLKTHSPSKVQVSHKKRGKESIGLFKFDWGHHGKNDIERGYGRKSFIDVLGIEYSQLKKRGRLESFNLLEIYSLEDFNNYLPALSWTASIKGNRSCYACDEKIGTLLTGGVGVAKVSKALGVWFFLEIAGSIKSKRETLYPQLEVGFKKGRDPFIWTSLIKVFNKGKINYEFESAMSYYFKKETAGVFEVLHDNYSKKTSLITGVKQHF